METEESEPGAPGITCGALAAEPNCSLVMMAPVWYRISYLDTAVPFDWAFTNWSVAPVAVTPPSGALKFVTAVGAAGGGTHCNGVHSCFVGSQRLDRLLTGSHTSVKQGGTLGSTRPVSPARLLIESSRASPEPGFVVEMVASRGLTTPVVPVQSP